MKNFQFVLVVLSAVLVSGCGLTKVVYRQTPVTAVSSIPVAPAVVSVPVPTPTVTVTPSPLPVQNLSCLVFDLSKNGLGNGNVPDFESLAPVASISLGTVDAPATTVSTAFQLFPAALSTQLKGAYGLDCTSLLVVPAEGNYNMAISSDDGSELFIDGLLILSDNGAHGMNLVTGSVHLTAGKHKIHLVASQNGQGQQGLELAWERPQDHFYQIIPATSFSK